MKESIHELVCARSGTDKTTLKKWVDQYIPQLKNGALVDLLATKNFKESLKKGVPVEVRGEVWEHFIGNHLRITVSLYEALLARVRLAEANIKNDIDFKKNIKVVEEDLHRTYTDLGYFRYGKKTLSALEEHPGRVLGLSSRPRLRAGHVLHCRLLALAHWRRVHSFQMFC